MPLVEQELKRKAIPGTGFAREELLLADDAPSIRTVRVVPTPCGESPVHVALVMIVIHFGQESTSGTGYGAVATGGFYTGITPGQYTLSGRITATTDNGLAIASAPTAIADGKYYSFYLSGPYNSTTKKSDFFNLEDAAPPQPLDYRVAYVRFVNAISNASPMTLYAKNTTSGTELPIGGSVAYKGAGALTPVPIGPYDLIARNTGSATNAITLAAVGFSAGRVVTVNARGDMTITSTTAATRPILTVSPDR